MTKNKGTNNENGLDITSLSVIEPHAVFYDWHVHEAFNDNPDEIYVPYGSGRLMENYLTWQFRNTRHKDPRLRIPLGKLVSIDILGAEPEDPNSMADKLTKAFNPFNILTDHDISCMLSLAATGKNSGVYHVSEESIKQAYEMLGKYCDTEPSGAIGLALYMNRYDRGQIEPGRKSLIINTGAGI